MQLSDLVFVKTHPLRHLLEHPIIPLLQTDNSLIGLFDDVIALDIQVFFDSLL